MREKLMLLMILAFFIKNPLNKVEVMLTVGGINGISNVNNKPIAALLHYKVESIRKTFLLSS
jgi:hypothetical protein